MSKRLYRSSTQKMFAGVCGGLADYFNIDVTIVRLLWVALSLASLGIGVLIYLISIIIIPVQDSFLNNDDSNSNYDYDNGSNTKNNSILFVGVVLIFMGGLALINAIFPLSRIWSMFGDYGWPILLIVIGAIIILTSFGRNKR